MPIGSTENQIFTLSGKILFTVLQTDFFLSYNTATFTLLYTEK